MTEAVKSYESRRTERKRRAAMHGARTTSEPFNEQEQGMVNQAWQAIMDHMNSDAVLAAPEFDDPLAEFVICTDASDYAIGGVLMQWQHEEFPGPGPDKEDLSKTNEKGIDPLFGAWRESKGWKLKVINYYAKTLIPAQRNYPAFDREAGGILMCVRHWADVITYHPTTVFTDSSVATSMLTKHMAPPRLHRA